MKLLSCVLLVSLTLLGCRSVNGPDPVAMVTYENVPIVTKSGKTLPLQEIRGVIADSAAQAGWKVAEGKSGPVVASYDYKDKHFTTIRIDYTQHSFSIAYESSKNLKYRLSKQQESYEPVQLGAAPRYPPGTPLIHGIYNKWVQNLKERIEIGFSTK